MSVDGGPWEKLGGSKPYSEVGAYTKTKTVYKLVDWIINIWHIVRPSSFVSDRTNPWQFSDQRLHIKAQSIRYFTCNHRQSGWRHQMETFSALLDFCAGNSPVPGEFSSQRPVTRSFGVFFDLCLNKQVSKHSGGWWFETPSLLLWRHCNANGVLSSQTQHG